MTAIGKLVFAGKVAPVVSASPGVLGGIRAQIALQISLNKLGMLVMPNSSALGLAHQAFDEKWLSRTPTPIRVSVDLAQRLLGRPAFSPQSRIAVTAGTSLTKRSPWGPRARVSAEWLISLPSDEAVAPNQIVLFRRSH